MNEYCKYEGHSYGVNSTKRRRRGSYYDYTEDEASKQLVDHFMKNLHDTDAEAIGIAPISLVQVLIL